MSNSIWKTGDPTYNPDRSGDDIIMEYHRKDGSKFYVVGSCGETNDRWAYLTDIIAQADKAERLERAVQYLKRLHIATIEKYNPKEKELAEQTIDYAIEMAIEQESNN